MKGNPRSFLLLVIVLAINWAGTEGANFLPPTGDYHVEGRGFFSNLFRPWKGPITGITYCPLGAFIFGKGCRTSGGGGGGVIHAPPPPPSRPNPPPVVRPGPPIYVPGKPGVKPPPIYIPVPVPVPVPGPPARPGWYSGCCDVPGIGKFCNSNHCQGKGLERRSAFVLSLG